MESLFSLELIVNFLKLNNLSSNKPSSSMSASCLFPTVAFRLLDYPTIAINLLETYDANELKNKIKINEPFEHIEKLPCFVELLDKFGRYVFSKGKSCLFRSNLNELKRHLAHAPLYLMILDTFFEPFKLVGTTLVPLTNLINEIYQETINDENIEPTSNRVDLPCTKMTHGVFDIKNLMGDTIGHISFACRLTSFGVSLLPHIDNVKSERRIHEMTEQQKASNKINLDQKEEPALTPQVQETISYTLNKNKSLKIETNKLISLETKPINKDTKLVQTVQIDYKDAEIQIINNEHNKITTEKTTQLPDSSHRILLADKEHEKNQQKFRASHNEQNQITYSVKHVQDEFIFNYYCPPPLKFNLNENDIDKASEKTNSDYLISNKLDKNQYLTERIEYLNKAITYQADTQEFDDNQDNFKNDNQKLTRTEKIEIRSRTNQDHTTIKSNFNFDQIPLLKCLFEEMSNLKLMIENTNSINNASKTSTPSLLDVSINSQHKTPNKPATKLKNNNIVGILRKNTANNNKNKSSKSHKEFLFESVNRLSKPHSREANNNIKTQSTKIDSSRNELDEEPIKQEKPKKILKYGLTNTHRMRVLANKPKNVKSIEQIHKNLLSQVKENLDEMNLSTLQAHATTETTAIQKNLEKILVSDETLNSGSLKNSQKILNTLNLSGTAKSNNNLSLLNKVEMESTYDYDNTINNQYNVSNRIYDHKEEDDNDEDVNLFQTNAKESESDETNSIKEYQQTSKVVQFGNTYVYNTDGAESSPSFTGSQTSITNQRQIRNSSLNKQSLSIENTSNKNSFEYQEKSIDLDQSFKTQTSSNDQIQNRNIFLENKNSYVQYDDDFNSSLDSSQTTSTTKQSTSTTTTSNFFTNAKNKKQQSPRASNNFGKKENIINELFNEDDEYDDIEYLTSNQSISTNRNRQNNSNNSHSYTMKSFIDEENEGDYNTKYQDDDDDENEYDN